jgi:hypothetical protein
VLAPKRTPSLEHAGCADTIGVAFPVSFSPTDGCADTIGVAFPVSFSPTDGCAHTTSVAFSVPFLSTLQSHLDCRLLTASACLSSK